MNNFDDSKKLYDYTSEKGDLAILGGSFNPIHNGHLAMAEAAYKKCLLPVIIMPNKSTYYKDNAEMADDNDRMEMVRLAAEEKDYLKYSDMEIKRGGVTHTIDTIRYLKSINPERKICFIIGGDSLEWIDRWVDADELLASLTFLSAIRGATDRERSEEIIRRIKEGFPYADIELLDMESIPVSSSEIRENIKQGKSIKGMVPDKIEEYILNRKLYKE